MKVSSRSALQFVFAFVFLCESYVLAQPLVTGNLTLYYDFDEIVINADGVKQFLDESGNNLPGTIYEGDLDVDFEPGMLRHRKSTSWRRSGELHAVYGR